MLYLPITLATTLDRELQAVFLLVLFVVIVVAAYIVTNMVARIHKGSLGNKNLEIIEAISVGTGKSVQLVRVGKKYLLIGVSKNEINMLQALEDDDIVISNEEASKSVIPFKQILSNYNHKDKRDIGDDHHETKDEE